jgi:hypothetical protein
VTRVTDMTGMFGASGGFALACAAAECVTQPNGDRLVSAASWGGALACLRLSAAS